MISWKQTLYPERVVLWDDPDHPRHKRQQVKTILLAGPSASGKSTLARALCQAGRRSTISTSSYLRSLSRAQSPSELFEFGEKFDHDNPAWLQNLVADRGAPAVVDAVRSHHQYNSFPESEVIAVNVTASPEDIAIRHLARNTRPVPTPWMFNRPDYVWNSSSSSLASAISALEQMSGGGVVDIVVGGQYGSEGKGKLCALLAPSYDVLVRSGGPNAGHWVRTPEWEYCYHHLPSGTRSNPKARIYLAAGMGFHPGRLLEEIGECGAQDRIRIDENAVAITPEDREFEHDLVKSVGSTSQGVGAAQARRVMRGTHGLVNGPRGTLGFPFPSGFKGMDTKVARDLARHLQQGDRVMLEGTQGSELSLYHGPYPWVTSRDTNVSGLLAEVGLPPSSVRDTWVVVRSLPIRVGGNSGPMFGELSWDDVAKRAGLQDDVPGLMRSELTSTTKRQRRVGEFDWLQFERAVELNRPTRLFLTFADYLSPRSRGVRTWADLPSEVTDFCDRLAREAGCPVAGVSTGRMQADTVLGGGYVR